MRTHSGSPMYAFIVSHMYSGSTLLTMLLDLHPQVATIGELYWAYPLRAKDPSSYECSCRARLRECPYWSGVHDDLAQRIGRTIDFERFPLRPELPRHPRLNRMLLPYHSNRVIESLSAVAVTSLLSRNHSLRTLVRNHNDYFGHIFEVTGTRCFVDASKAERYLRFLPLFHDERRTTRVIHLRRSAKGVMASMKRYSQGPFQEKWLDEWVSGETRLDRRVAAYGDSAMSVWYEDLVREPAEMTSRICSFLHLGALPSLDLGSVAHHIVGNNRARFLLEREGIEMDESWRVVLTESEAEFIDRRLERVPHSLSWRRQGP